MTARKRGVTTPLGDRRRISRCRDRVIKELDDLGAYIFHIAKSESTYIKFKDVRLRSLLICNHGNIARYRYKWNIELSGKTRTEDDKGTRRFFFNEDDLKTFFDRLRKYKATIDRNEAEGKTEDEYFGGGEPPKRSSLDPLI